MFKGMIAEQVRQNADPCIPKPISEITSAYLSSTFYENKNIEPAKEVD